MEGRRRRGGPDLVFIHSTTPLCPPRYLVSRIMNV